MNTLLVLPLKISKYKDTNTKNTGISIFASKITIENNEIYNCFQGISVAINRNDIKILNNHIFNNTIEGISLDWGTGTSITNNTIENNKWGITCDEVDYLSIEGNKINNNYYGISLTRSYKSPLLVYNNVLINNMETGITIFEVYNSQILGNIIKNSTKGISISLDGYDLVNKVTKSCNVIKSCIIADCGTGIEIISSSFNRILTSVIESNNIGILIHGSYVSLSSGTWNPAKQNTIIRNSISNNKQNGIIIDDASENGVYSNDIYNNGNGITLTSLLATSELNWINNNRIIHNTGYGIVSYISNIVDATCNWWGSNEYPSNKIWGSLIDFDPWIILKLYEGPTVSPKAWRRVVADLTYTSAGWRQDYTNQEYGGAPTTMMVSFGTDQGTIDTPKSINEHSMATSTLILPSAFSGTVYTWIMVDDEFLILPINIASQTPVYFKSNLFNLFNSNIDKIMKTGITVNYAATSTNQSTGNSGNNSGSNSGNSGSNSGGTSGGPYSNIIIIIAAMMTIIIISSGGYWLFTRK
jgi:Nitrous oxidase accessory protein